MPRGYRGSDGDQWGRLTHVILDRDDRAAKGFGMRISMKLGRNEAD